MIGAGELARTGQGDSRRRGVGARCQWVMQTASVLGMLMLVTGIILARAGLRGRLVATLVYCYWLAWPAGVICCGLIVASWWLRGHGSEG